MTFAYSYFFWKLKVFPGDDSPFLKKKWQLSQLPSKRDLLQHCRIAVTLLQSTWCANACAHPNKFKTRSGEQIFKISPRPLSLLHTCTPLFIIPLHCSVHCCCCSLFLHRSVHCCLYLFFVYIHTPSLFMVPLHCSVHCCCYSLLVVTVM